MSGRPDETQTQGVAAFVQALIAAAELGEREHPMGEVALALVRGGWPVFPCDAQRKNPLVPNGFHARSRDVTTVEGWWTSHPTATVGIVPGDGGLIALDADSSQALASIEGAGLLPDGFLSALRDGTLDGRHGLVVATGGSSEPFEFDGCRVPPLHLYLEAPASPAKLAGVVCRFDRGYVIAPGSLGRARYRLIGRGAPVPFRPMIEVSSAQTGPVTRGTPDSSLRAPDIDRLRQALALIPNDAKTDRDQYVEIAHAVKGAVGLERDADGLELFLTWAERWPDGADPVEDERVYSTINHSKVRTGWETIWRLAAKHGFDATLEIEQSAQADFPAEAPDPRSGSPDETTTFASMLTKVRDAPNEIARVLAVARIRKRFHLTGLEIQRAAASLLPAQRQDINTGHLLSELLLRPELLTTPTPAIPYLAWPGLKTLLSAREKTGKSTLALAGAAAASRGASFLAEQTTSKTVLWVTEEPLGVVVRRASAMSAEPARFIVLPMGSNPSEELQQAVQRWTPEIVVIDTLYRYAGVEDENDAAGWLPVFTRLDEITRGNAALLLLVHATKASKGGEYRGSSAIGGHVDLILSMNAPDAGAVRKLRAVGRIPLTDFEVRLANDRSSFELLGQQDRDAETVTRVRAFLAANGLTTRSRLRRNLQIGQPKVDNALKRLVDEGTIIQDAGGYRLLTASEELEGAADQPDAALAVAAPSKKAHVGAA